MNCYSSEITMWTQRWLSTPRRLWTTNTRREYSRSIFPPNRIDTDCIRSKTINFQMVQVTTPVCEFVGDGEIRGKPNGGGYLQWRPVSYTAAGRNVTSSTDAEYYPLISVPNHMESSMHSLIQAFYGYEADDLLLQTVKVSLGGKGDGFYKNSRYSSWWVNGLAFFFFQRSCNEWNVRVMTRNELIRCFRTFTIGYGDPPSEQFSLLVIMIISIGLGLPAIIMIVAGIYMCARRRYQRRDQLSLNG